MVKCAHFLKNKLHLTEIKFTVVNILEGYANTIEDGQHRQIKFEERLYR